jgi:hypothetical protein
VGTPALGEQQPDVVLQRGLVAFDGEVVVRPARDQVGGQVALGQQRIGGDVKAGDVDGVEHRRSRLDLIRALDLIAVVDAQAADFFWV